MKSYSISAETLRAPQRAQVTIEYFVLFVLFALATLISLTTLDDELRLSLRNFFGSAANRMVNEVP